jgi:hypothetical protein
MHLLDRRAAGAVEEDDSLGQQFAQKFETVVQVSHSTIAEVGTTAIYSDYISGDPVAN